MTTRKKHPNKEIEEALRYAESKEWRVEKAGKSAHAWGIMSCSLASQEGCKRRSIWSTPGNPEGHARQIRNYVDKCFHKG
ncbi:hypothetical protein [Endozoicomonas sp.]|uniref:hypothetical protein n=1 Tax=Endozoicomonas sp. TaxID=1892382 RepID=UPI00383BCF97